MAVPFLKKNKSGISISVSRELYPAQACARVQALYGDSVAFSADGKKRVRVLVPSGLEEDILEVLESLLYYSRHA